MIGWMIGNCFFPSESQYNKNEEDYKLFLILSAKLIVNRLSENVITAFNVYYILIKL